MVAEVCTPSCTTTTTTSPNLTTSVTQCDTSGSGGGGTVTCSVQFTNVISGATTLAPATVDQCIGSGTGGGTPLTVVCNPAGSTVGATVTQCNGSGNGGGGTMRVQCTVPPSTVASALPVTVDQCNGSANGGGSTVTCNATVTNTVLDLSLTKSASPARFTGAGQTITYSYVVTNTGQDPLTSVTINDALTGLSAMSCNPIVSVSTPLAAGATTTCTATYQTTSTDVTNGSIQNTATATGTDASGNSDTSSPSSVTVALSALSLMKSTTSTGYDTTGQTIPYSFLVTNTGETMIWSIHIVDSYLFAITCPEPHLPGGGSETCTGTYTVTNKNVGVGSVTNVAFAQGHNLDNVVIKSNLSTVTVDALTSSITMEKSTTSLGYTAAGQTIPYNYLVTNTGQTTLTKIAVDDNRLDAQKTGTTCPEKTLAAGTSETCTGTYTVTATDVGLGSVTNTARALAVTPDGRNIASAFESVTVHRS